MLISEEKQEKERDPKNWKGATPRQCSLSLLRCKTHFMLRHGKGWAAQGARYGYRSSLSSMQSARKND